MRTALALLILTISLLTGTPARAQPTPTAAMAHTIDHLITSLKSAKKPIPAWALDLAIRAIDTWKTFKNGQKFEAVEAIVLAALKQVVEIKDLVEAGRELSEREYKLTRELLDQYSARLDEFNARLSAVEILAQANAGQLARLPEVERIAKAAVAQVVELRQRQDRLILATAPKPAAVAPVVVVKIAAANRVLAPQPQSACVDLRPFNMADPRPCQSAVLRAQDADHAHNVR